MRSRTTVTLGLAASLALVGMVLAQDKPKGDEKKEHGGELSKLAGTKWAGTGELWLDPLGNEAQKYDCTLTVDAATVGSLSYTWSDHGKPQTGVFALGADGAVWSDTWHQPKSVKCALLADSWGLFGLHYNYRWKGGPEWGWRIVLAQRPTGELVLQMINIAPWGEEKRAVRMVFKRAP